MEHSEQCCAIRVNIAHTCHFGIPFFSTARPLFLSFWTIESCCIVGMYSTIYCSKILCFRPRPTTMCKEIERDRARISSVMWPARLYTQMCSTMSWGAIYPTVHSSKRQSFMETHDAPHKFYMGGHIKQNDRKSEHRVIYRLVVFCRQNSSNLSRHIVQVLTKMCHQPSASMRTLTCMRFTCSINMIMWCASGGLAGQYSLCICCHHMSFLIFTHSRRNRAHARGSSMETRRSFRFGIWRLADVLHVLKYEMVMVTLCGDDILIKIKIKMWLVSVCAWNTSENVCQCGVHVVAFSSVGTLRFYMYICPSCSIVSWHMLYEFAL